MHPHTYSLPSVVDMSLENPSRTGKLFLELSIAFDTSGSMVSLKLHKEYFKYTNIP
jgi:hypothetical protein